jgi:hypothetical protein
MFSSYLTVSGKIVWDIERSGHVLKGKINHNGTIAWDYWTLDGRYTTKKNDHPLNLNM